MRNMMNNVIESLALKLDIVKVYNRIEWGIDRQAYEFSDYMMQLSKVETLTQFLYSLNLSTKFAPKFSNNNNTHDLPSSSSYLIPAPDPPLSVSILSREPIVCAPGTDPLAVPASYPHTTAGFKVRPEFEVYLYGTSKNEVVTETDTIPVEHGAGTLSETTAALTVHSCWNSSMVNQELMNDVVATKVARKTAQSVSCEVCKMTCNTKDVFEKHVKGKKHAKNLRMFSSATSQNGSDMIQDVVLEVRKPMGNGVIVSEVLKEVVQSFRCEVCKIDCNNKYVLDLHVQGKKHKKNVQTLAVQNSLSITVEDNSHSTVPQISSYVMHNKNPGQMILDVADSVEGELEKKKHNILQNGASIGSLLFCKICDVVCNNQVVYSTHLAGRKHTAQVASGKQASGEPKIIPPIVCETCKISCSGEDNFQKHLSGKKHLKNLEKSMKIISTLVDKPSNLQSSEEKHGAVQFVCCDICKIICNTSEVLTHFTGKKHRKKLDALKIIMGLQTSIVHPTATSIIGSTQAGNMGLQELSELDKGVTNLETHVEEDTNNVHTLWCKLCGIGCNSSDNLKSHTAGNRHRKNLEKLKKPIGPVPPPVHAMAETAAPMIGPMENTNPEGNNGEIMNFLELTKEKKRSVSINDDLETKRQKIVNEGAATDSVRDCTVCSVVCNSPMVFISHLAGKKHAAMAMKQTQAIFQAQNA